MVWHILVKERIVGDSNTSKMAKLLGMTQQAISRCLKFLGMIKIGTVPVEATKCRMAFFTFDGPLPLQKKKSFLHLTTTGDEK